MPKKKKEPEKLKTVSDLHRKAGLASARARKKNPKKMSEDLSRAASYPKPRKASAVKKKTIPLSEFQARAGRSRAEKMTKEERMRMTSLPRKPNAPRCPCGKNTLARAQARWPSGVFRCCVEAGFIR